VRIRLATVGMSHRRSSISAYRIEAYGAIMAGRLTRCN
jgi:hypothetical protein